VSQAPPQLSPDGKFYWDGTRWIPVDAPAPSGYGNAPQPRVAYGGLFIRFAAYLIDSFIIGLPMGILLFVLAITGVVASPASPSAAPPPPGGTSYGAFYLNPPALFLFWLFVLIVAAGYYAYFWGTSGSTLGMRLFRLRVADANTGRPIGIGRAIVRYVGFIVAGLPCWIGLLWAAFDSRAQGWHDKIASTVVLQS
jgi:uncharacterized RDD family membrane protein YckC